MGGLCCIVMYELGVGKDAYMAFLYLGLLSVLYT